MKKIAALFLLVIVIFSLAACSASISGITSGGSSTSSSGTTLNSQGSGSSSSSTSGSTTTAVAAGTVPTAMADNTPADESAADYTWDAASAVSISLNGDTISASGRGVTVSGSTATITAAGTYSLSGTLTDGQILVDTQDTDPVKLVLNGVDLHSSTSAPLYVEKAEKVILILADGSTNRVSDGVNYVFASADDTEPNAAVFSKADLAITGNGSLTVEANHADGITSKDGLIIDHGTISITSADDGMRGKDYLLIKNGSITVDAQGDGLKSDNAEDAALGYISIEGGTLNISAGGDAVQAVTDVMVSGGDFNITTHGSKANASSKGIKGTASVTIDGGTFILQATDDGVHSNGSITINGGMFEIASGDDGMHADGTLTINNGQIQVVKSYEGLESASITINNGTIQVVASDDGINGAGGVDGSGTTVTTGNNNFQGPGMDRFGSSGNNSLTINGGYIYVDGQGDGIDVNGSITMTGGTVLVNGPTANNNGALDYDSSFKISGGILVAAGSSGMAMAPDTTSSQNSLLVNFTSVQQPGTLINIQNSAGETLLTFAPIRQFQSIAFSSPDLEQGATYTVNLGGSSTGTQADSLYTGGTYSGGTLYTSLTLSGVTTQVGQGGMGGGPGGGGGRPRP